MPELEVPNGLKFSVLEKIREAEWKQARRRLILLKLAMTSSVATSIFASALFSRELLASDFWNIATLGFTDFGLILANWQNFFWSLLETLPTEPLLSLAFPLLLIMLLGKKYDDQKQFIKFNSLNA